MKYKKNNVRKKTISYVIFLNLKKSFTTFKTFSFIFSLLYNFEKYKQI